MNDYAKAIDVKEMGKRFKLVRQKLGMTQTKIAEELGTSQLMVFRMEKGENVLSPFFLSMLMYYSQHVSLDGLLSKKFDIEDHEALTELFHLSTLLQMPNDCRLVNVEFFGNFLYNCKRISFDDCSQLVLVNF